MEALIVCNLVCHCSTQDVGGMLSLLEMVEQCLRAGKKQAWHGTSVTNICVGLLSGLKVI